MDREPIHIVEHDPAWAASFAARRAPLEQVLAPWLVGPIDERDRKWSYCHPEPVARTHHLHVVEDASTGWPRWLAFRDHLRAHPDLAAEYAEPKRALAAEDPRDRPRYRAGKEPFIRRVLDDIASRPG